ncbi:hypothetical protein A2V82_09720 [candidate division KSB1 bacterium RBG_16_48_16]|nr:MAG: hypothetical protein A2V82_09720 [candidate division KSB1 bacterium RBG_16_48_16]
MKNTMIYVWTILGLVILSTVAEMTSYPLFRAPAPAGFGTKEVVILFLLKILFDSDFILMFRLSRGSKLAENGPLYGLLWFLGFSVPSEVGFWLVFKYKVAIVYAGLLSGLVTFPLKGWIVKKIKLP